MRVLYIEDNPDVVNTVRRIITHFGYELLVAENVKDGLALLTSAPNVVLVDMLLPDGDANDFMRQARPLFPDLPIIVVTGYAMPGEREACFAAGCTEYYIKPVDVNVLIDLFQRYT